MHHLYYLQNKNKNKQQQKHTKNKKETIKIH